MYLFLNPNRLTLDGILDYITHSLRPQLPHPVGIAVPVAIDTLPGQKTASVRNYSRASKIVPYPDKLFVPASTHFAAPPVFVVLLP
jgi:hypothetical protein